MVEKSKKKRFCDAKYCKKGAFPGDDLLEPKRETPNGNDLRAPQATPQGRALIDGISMTLVR
jgi:hypothetical protein